MRILTIAAFALMLFTMNSFAQEETEATQTEISAEEEEVTFGKFNDVVYMTFREEIKMSELQNFFAKHFPEMMQLAIENDLDVEGMPQAIYYSWDEETGMTDVAAALALGEYKDNMEGYKGVKIRSQMALTYNYYGPYEDAAKAHEKIAAYMKEHSCVQNGPVIEEYVTDPGSEPNPEKWLTKISYLVERTSQPD